MKKRSSQTQVKSILLVLGFLTVSFGLKAQEGTYWIGLPFKNPAAIATPSDWIYADYSRLDYGSTTETTNLFVGSFDYKISQKAGTIGLDFSYEKYNIESALLIKANYAYDIQVLENSILSFGVSAGTTFNNINFSEYQIYDPVDPDFTFPSDERSNTLNGNAGIFLHAPRLSSGLSLTFETQIPGKNEPAYRYSYTFPAVLTGVLAYRVVNNNNLTITPNILVDYVSEKFSSIPGLQLKYKNAWAGYQNFDFENVHSINLGVDVKSKFRIGYSYGFSDFFNTEGLNIHEFMFGYRLN